MRLKSKLCTLSLAAALVCSASTSDITVDNGGVRLAGTLTMPDGTVPKAVVVMATGSGTQDRDETVMGHKPFRAIAESLARAGYASLRLDDRGAGESSEGRPDDTTDDFSSDIAAALAQVGSMLPDVPRGVLGHSEGGWIALDNASRGTCDFIITMGCPAVAGDSLIMWQGRVIYEKQGAGEMWQNLHPSLRRRYEICKSAALPPVAEALLMSEITSAQPETALPQLREVLHKQIGVMLSPWYRNFLRHDPTDQIKSIATPWLALNGSLDTQVPPENLDRIHQLNPAATVVLMPELNHLMLKCTTGLPDEYPTLAGDIDPAVTEAIVGWLDATVAK